MEAEVAYWKHAGRLYLLNALLPGLGKMNTQWLRFGEHRVLRQRVLESYRWKDTIKTIYSEIYGSIGGRKHSLDQDRVYCHHQPQVVGATRRSTDVPSFSWVNTLLAT